MKRLLNTVSTLLLASLLFMAYGCKGTVTSEFECESVSYDNTTGKPTKVYAYIDASGSMKGYFSLQSDGRFITALSDANPDRINWMDFSFTKLDGIPTNVLLTSKFSGGQSRFDKMLPDIITRDSLESNDNISLLFTDGILSASKDETSANPNYMIQSFVLFKNYIARALLSKSNMAIAVLKLESKYNGGYWNCQNNCDTINVQNRPFYVIAMGKPTLIRYFIKNNKLGASLYTAFGIYDKKIKNQEGTLFTPVVPKDFEGDKLVSKTIAFTLTLPDYVAQYGSEYIKENIIINLDGKDESKRLKTLVSVSGNQLTIENWYIYATSYPRLKPGKNTLQIKISHVVSSEWTELYSEDDLRIKIDTAQQQKTFALKYLIEGIQEGVERQDTIFSSSITFTK